jgi:hypothetical protein
VLAFTVVGGRIVEIDVIADPARLAKLDLAALDAGVSPRSSRRRRTSSEVEVAVERCERFASPLRGRRRRCLPR